MIKIEINNAKKYPISNKFILSLIKTAAKLNKKINGTVEINLVSNMEIQNLNRLWRQKNKATDVLSFAWQEDEKLKTDCLGQIFISFPRVVRQAKEYRVSIRNEFGRMLAHGLLHLAGFEHKNNQTAPKMFALQEKILLKEKIN